MGTCGTKNSRKASRDRIRQKIAKAKLCEQRYQEILTGIAAINAEKDRLAEAHVADCAELQSELQDIERYQIARLVDNQSADEELEVRRRGLLAVLNEKNATLAGSIGAQDRLAMQLERERLIVGKGIEDLALKSELMTLADAGLIVKLNTAQSRLNWAVRRRASIRDRLDVRRTDQLVAEFDDVTREIQEATALVEHCHQAILDE